jgi:hypothetical protein
LMLQSIQSKLVEFYIGKRAIKNPDYFENQLFYGSHNSLQRQINLDG